MTIEDANKSIIEKFNEADRQIEEDTKKREAEEAKAKDAKDVKTDDKAEETPKAKEEEPKAKEEAKPKAKEVESTAEKEPQKEPDKQEDKVSKEEPKAEPKADTKAKEDTKAEDTKETEPVEDVKAASAKKASKDKEVEKGKTESTDMKKSEGVVSISNETADKILEVITKSYNEILARVEKSDSKVESIEGTVNSMQESLLPFVSKAMKLLPEEDVQPTPKDADPEQVAVKSAKLEDKQHAESVEKSAGKEDTDTIAKDDTSTVVDEVIEKSAKDDVVKTQTEEPKVEQTLTNEDYRYAARGMQKEFFTNLQKGIQDGKIEKSAIDFYKNLWTDVQNDSASIKDVKKFIDFASK